MKKYIIIAVVVILAIVGFIVYKPSSNVPEAISIEGNTGTTLVDDKDMADIKPVYFGNEVKGDFNNDGLSDTAFLITKDGGGSGTFYYIVAALGAPKTAGASVSYLPTNDILLGDRIAPQTTEFRDGKIIVNYADRKANEPMSAKPSIGVSRYFKIQNNKLVEVK